VTSIDRIRLKVGRARKHISDLEQELKAFFSTNPYKVGVKRDPKTRRLIYYLTDVAEVPEQVSLIAADVLQNLGSALDHLAYSLLLVGTGGQPGNQAKRVFFPIEDDAAKYASESPRKLKGMTPAAFLTNPGNGNILTRLERRGFSKVAFSTLSTPRLTMSGLASTPTEPLVSSVG
jgi:hypothetical protein